MDELILDSLRRRIRALHSLYDDATSTMTIEQVNHFEREGVVPIAFCLFHIVNMMDSLDATELTRVVIARPFPPQIADTFSARVAGDVGVTLLDATECWIYQHGLRHMGEIELARGLVGLGGMTS